MSSDEKSAPVSESIVLVPIDSKGEQPMPASTQPSSSVQLESGSGPTTTPETAETSNQKPVNPDNPSKCCVCKCCFPAYRRWGPLGRTLFITGIVLGVLALAAIVFVLYCVINVYQPNQEAFTYLASVPGAEYTVVDGRYTYTAPVPAANGTRVGLVFLPGAKVNPIAYAPMCRNLVVAAQGELSACVVTPVPLNLAFFGTGLPGTVASSMPQIQTWIIGGHSLGGAFAAQTLIKNRGGNPALWRGLQTLAAYSPDDMNAASFSDPIATRVEVAAFQGTLDGVQTVQDFQAKVPNFPKAGNQTEIFYIQGGNHAQMGYYGPQAGDNPATITLDQQQAQIVAGTLELVRRLRRS